MFCLNMRRRIVWALVACVLVVAVNAYAQSTRATIVGTVKDPSGAVLPGVTVIAKNVDTGLTRNTVTNEVGDYTLPLLPIGSYEVSAEIGGFKTQVKSGITLQVDDRLRVDFAMEIGQISEKVMVTGEAPLLQSENASIGNVIDHAKIVDLPLDGREFYSLAQLNPAVYAPAQGSTLGFRGGMNIAGVSEIANSYTLDGVENMDAASNQPAHRPSVDTIQEFKVLTGTYPAEYGRYSGGQVIVTTKSGTNDFHGTAYNFYRNSAMDARNFFATTVSPFTRNNFGGTIGGPVIKNRTFFFGGYEGRRDSQQMTAVATVPSMLMRGGNFSELLNAANPFTGRVTTITDPVTKKAFDNNVIPPNRIDPVAAKLIDLEYGKPNRVGANNYLADGPDVITNDQFNARIDHKQSDKHNLSTGYEFMNLREQAPFGNSLCSTRFMPGQGCLDVTKTQTVFVSDVYIFSPSLIHELRLGYTRLTAIRTPGLADSTLATQLGIPGLPGAVFPHNQAGPQVTISGFATLGPGGSLPQGRSTNTYNLIDSMTVNRGSHSFKFGMDWRYFQFNSFHAQDRNGTLGFNGFMTGYAMADFLLGFPRTASRNTGIPYTVTTDDQYDFYFQDDWKASSRFTFNLGLRYEYNRPIYERTDQISSWDPTTNMLRLPHGGVSYVDSTTGQLVIKPGNTDSRAVWNADKNNFAPRIGIAFRPTASNSFVIRSGYGIYYNLTPNGNGMSGLYRGLPYRISSSITASTTIPIALGDPFTRAPGRAAARFSHLGVANNYLTAFAQQYSLGIQKELTSSLMLETTYMGSRGTKIFDTLAINQPRPGAGSVDARRPYQPWGTITYTDNMGNSWYNSLQAKVERRMAKGVSGLLSYTFGKSTDTGTGLGAGGDGNYATQDPLNYKANKGLSAFDIRHRFVGSYVIELPFGKGRHFMNGASRPLDMLFGGWMVSGILTLQSGAPFTPTISFDNANTGTTNHPNLIGDWHVDHASPERWFNRNAFCYAASCGLAQYTYGNAGRNILRGPGKKNLDFSLMKDFMIQEGKSLQFRGEFFNLTNHPNFFLPSGTVDLATGGTISQAANARTVQLALKFIF